MSKYKVITLKMFFGLMSSALIKLVTMTTLLMLLLACVTTEKGGIAKNTSTEESVAVRVDAAKQYLQKRDFESARRHLKAGLELDAQSADVHDALALTFHASGELELAKKHYKKAIDYGQGNSRYRMNYASFLYQLNEFESAEKQLKYVTDDSLYEKRELALVLLGLTQQQMLEEKNAIRSFERALVLNSKNRRVLRELSIMNYDSRNFQLAWRYFQRYRDVTRQPSAEMLLLGVQLASELNEQDAKASYLIALKNLYPDSREYQSYLRDRKNQERAK